MKNKIKHPRVYSLKFCKHHDKITECKASNCPEENRKSANCYTIISRPAKNITTTGGGKGIGVNRNHE